MIGKIVSVPSSYSWLRDMLRAPNSYSGAQHLLAARRRQRSLAVSWHLHLIGLAESAATPIGVIYRPSCK